MKSKLLQESPKTYALVFDKGDVVMAGLSDFAKRERLSGSHFTAIGALSGVTLGYFDRERKDYKTIPLADQAEVLALVGDIALDQGEPKVHAHMVVGKADGAAHGGHLLEARVWPTLEVILVESPEHLRRETDPETGLALIRLGTDQSPADKESRREGAPPNDKRNDEQMLIIFTRPINRQADFAASRDLIGQDLQAKPFSEIFGLEPRVVNEPRELFGGSLLIALCERQFGLATGLFFNDRKNELGDRLDLMAVRPRQHLFDKLFHACRLNLCCHSTNRITQVANLCRHARLQKVSGHQS